MKLFRLKEDNYKHYAPIYDAFKGDRHDNIRMVRQIIEKYNPKAKTILEVACGTGALLEGLANTYTVVGLDNSPSMLRRAKRKMPESRFILGDMADFDIGQTFDVLYCLHNSVNHLLGFDRWEKFFACAAKHLAKGGVFLFDSNPAATLDHYAAGGYGVTQIADGYVLAKILKDDAAFNRYVWRMEVFRRQRGWNTNTHKLRRTEVVVETFPDKQITEALSQHFTSIKSFTLDQAEKVDDTGRTYYVCRKS